MLSVDGERLRSRREDARDEEKLLFDCIVLVIYSHIRSSAEPGADESVTSDEGISEQIREET